MATPVQQKPESEFVRYVKREWMWKQEPPLVSSTDFANFLGLARQTVFNWWKGQRPQIDALIIVSNKTGLSFRKLLELNNYPIPFELLSDS